MLLAAACDGEDGGGSASSEGGKHLQADLEALQEFPSHRRPSGV